MWTVSYRVSGSIPWGQGSIDIFDEDEENEIIVLKYVKLYMFHQSFDFVVMDACAHCKKSHCIIDVSGKTIVVGIVYSICGSLACFVKL